MSETWLSVSAAARAIGEHRQQLQRLMQAGKIPRRLISNSKPAQLRLEGLAEAVAGAKRHRIDSRPAPPLEPEPLPPDAPTQAEREVTRLQAQLAAVQAREAAWIAHYSAFRTWASEESSFALLHALPDPAPIGDVMVYTRETLLEKLKPLDAAELASRFPR